MGVAVEEESASVVAAVVDGAVGAAGTGSESAAHPINSSTAIDAVMMI
jgi:hypothetical protein